MARSCRRRLIESRPFGTVVGAVVGVAVLALATWLVGWLGVELLVHLAPR
jgi:hypothetical protein